VTSDFLFIQVDLGEIINCSKIDKVTFTDLWFKIEGLPVPYYTFIIFQFRELRIKVAGNLKEWSAIELIFEKLKVVFNNRISPNLSVYTIISRVDDYVPFAVEACFIATSNILHWQFILCGKAGK
jgi:hypothetical protein